MRSTWIMAGVMFLALLASFRYSDSNSGEATLPASLQTDLGRSSPVKRSASQPLTSELSSFAQPDRSIQHVGDARKLISTEDAARIAARWSLARGGDSNVLPQAAAAENPLEDAERTNGARNSPISTADSTAESELSNELSLPAGADLQKLVLAGSVAPVALAGTLLAAPSDFLTSRIGSDNYPIPAWSKHLAGLKIMLDPGHGGDADQAGFKRGPTGVREAEINLRLALYLRELLAAAGADVRLTRESDCLVSLEDRAALANDWPADIFVSLHHNAVDDHPETNYSSVWHHGDVDRNPASLDLARFLADGLHDTLRLPQVNDVPVKSDFLMYPVGFAVLRHAKVPAALCECSFYSNPQEEQRLRDPEYVLREAHGLFLALSRYAQSGLPRLKIVSPASGRIEKDEARVLVFDLDDGLRKRRSWGWQRRMLLKDSIVARIDGTVVKHTLVESREGYRLKVTLPDDLPNGPHQAEVQFQNMNKNSVVNPRVEFEYEGGEKEVG